jgi:hypothetical protein
MMLHSPVISSFQAVSAGQHSPYAQRLDFILSLEVRDFMMLQLLRLFNGMILQIEISFVVLHCVPVASCMETLININLNVGQIEVKERWSVLCFRLLD